MRFDSERLKEIKRDFGKAYKEFDYNPYTAMWVLDDGSYEGVLSIHIQEDGTYKYQYFPKMNIDREKILEQNLIGFIELGNKRYLVTTRQAERLLENDVFSIDAEQHLGRTAITYTDVDGIHTEDVNVIMKTQIKLCIIVGESVVMIETTKKKESYNDRGRRVANSDTKTSMTNIPLKDFYFRNI